jgi:uncharacterized repeat protein (TIGR04138 family)
MSMIDPSHPLAKLLREDPRYKLEAYVFVFEALNYAHNVLGLGEPRKASGKSAARSARRDAGEQQAEEENERHLTGQQLCEAIRQYALEQYGRMAKCVLNSWGVYSTSDFGEIVFNLIRIEQMRKTPEDKREDFDNVFDFDKDLVENFKISIPERS